MSEISDQPQVQDELYEYADRMLEAERIAHLGVWRWDVVSGVVRWSDELHRIYGLNPGEFPGTVDAFVAHLHHDDRERVWGCIERAVQHVEPFVFEERIVRADGAVRVLLSQGHVLAGPGGAATTLVGVCQDVTERVHAKLALGLSERRMRAIIDNTPSIVAVKDLDGCYLMANAETGRILGRSADELVGLECAELFPSISDQLRANDRKAAAGGEPVFDEAVLVQDGEPRTYETVTFVLPDDNGLPVETCTVATDVIERRERESERRERVDWEDRIGSALREDRMLVCTQPVVNIVTREPEGCEMLVRMRAGDGHGGLLAPAKFLPAAERFGLVQAIDVWMVRQAFDLLRDLGADYVQGFHTGRPALLRVD